jgi:hypothetical protein
MNKTKKQILEDFNTKGVFPTDEQLWEAIKGDDNYTDILQLELEMIDTAYTDVNHPYHSMVC